MALISYFNAITFIASFLRGATQGNDVTARAYRTGNDARATMAPEPHGRPTYFDPWYAMHNTQSRLPVNDNDVVTSIATIGTFEVFFYSTFANFLSDGENMRQWFM